MDDWRWRSAAELGAGIGRGEIDPVALCEGFLDAISAHPHGGEIYARTTSERARAEARAARARAHAGLRRSPLDGVPISWKDLFDSAGVATEAGSAQLRGRVPDSDARVLANATAAGLVCLGKTHLTELAFSGLGLNPVTATPPNVHDAWRVAGGSSSGAAASLAYGLAAAAIGSDTAGSVRIPAAWNDLVGLKTTHGALPLDGVVPLCPGFDTAGPLTRTVADAALLLAALAGAPAPDLRGASLRRTRFLVLEGVPFSGLDPAVADGFEAAVRRLSDAGAAVERAGVAAVGAAMELAGVLFGAEAYGTWRDTLEADPSAVFPPILERFQSGRDVAAADYVAARAELTRLRRAYADRTCGFDAVLLPTCAILPPETDRLAADPAYFAERNLLTLRNTRIASLLGLCALTVPTGNRWVGLTLQAPAGADRRLLRLGAAVERALGP